MKAEEKITAILKDNKIRLVITVPCKFFVPLLDKIRMETSIRLMWPAREEEGLGISAGCYLGGLRSVLLIQNSGLGNMVNAIKSLNQYYNIPFFAIVSHRGGADEKIDAQRPMGEATAGLLDLLGIKYHILETPEQVDKINEAVNESFTKGETRIVLLKPSFWKGKA